MIYLILLISADSSGHGRLEPRKFHSPSKRGDNQHTPANAPGTRHVAFAVEDIEDVVAGLRGRGAKLVAELELPERLPALLCSRAGGNHH